MIVISQDGVHAMAGLQPPSNSAQGAAYWRSLRNVVPGQGHDVRLQTVGCLDGAFDLLAACERAVMNVGKLNYPKAFERSRESRQVDGMVFDREQIWLDSVPIRAAWPRVSARVRNGVSGRPVVRALFARAVSI